MRTGEVIYTPPVGRATCCATKLANWERYLHEAQDIDPLIRMAVGHYQFEAIHPLHRRQWPYRARAEQSVPDPGKPADSADSVSAAVTSCQHEGGSTDRLLLDVTREQSLGAVADLPAAAAWRRLRSGRRRRSQQFANCRDMTVQHVKQNAPKIYSARAGAISFSICRTAAFRMRDKRNCQTPGSLALSQTTRGNRRAARSDAGPRKIVHPSEIDATAHA